MADGGIELGVKGDPSHVDAGLAHLVAGVTAAGFRWEPIGGSSMKGSGRWFDELAVGETFGSSVTITDAHLVLGAGYVADFNPLHVDEEFARKSRFGGRILHGMLTSALMGGPVGMHFHGTAMAYLEHNARFLAPVRPGDTLATRRGRSPGSCRSPRTARGMVELEGTATNQAGVVAARATGKIMVFVKPGRPDRPARQRLGRDCAPRRDALAHERRAAVDEPV